MNAKGPNAQQIEYWNDQAGPKWVERTEQLDELLAPLGDAVIERANVQKGERILDVGCGTGHASALLAKQVGRAGEVLGVDVSAPMLEKANTRSKAQQIHFEMADAQTMALAGADFSLIFSRFGVMFFSNPTQAFANLREALEEEGRLAFICWQDVSKNKWMQEPLAAALKHLPAPTAEPPAANAPGPFSFADPDHVRGILEKAGFTDVEIEGIETKLTIPGNLDEATDFMMNMGPVGGISAGADEAKLEKATKEVRKVLTKYKTRKGIQMPAAAWIVTAKRTPGSKEDS